MKAIHAFLKVCYIAQHNVIYKKSLHDLRHALNHFHQYCEIFHEVSVHNNFSLPCQHSLTHHESLIWLFSTPNGISTSITESKHIVTVKRSWYHLSKNNTLRQILQTNLHLPQLAAAHADFKVHGMLTPLASHAATSPSQPQTQRDDMEPDEDEATSVAHKSLRLVHSDVKLGQT
ncbi:hypothetical protein J3R82DRAFT_10767 [Butyriboletus roseoflavus]|nr:hypothetical protein J3R82DRAFT_10767 [Butyriboletus roseoflavus]